MSKFRISSKMYLCIIISCLLVAAGIAMGLVSQFVWKNGFFNWGSEYASYQSIHITYNLEIDQDGVEEICEATFDEYGINYYGEKTSDNNAAERYIEYLFLNSVDSDTVKSAATAIDAQLNAVNAVLCYAIYSEAETLIGGGKDLMFVGIALASIVVFQFLYFLVRYKLTMAIAAFIANVHNLTLFLALLALTRVTVSFSVMAMGVLVVLLTMICSAVFFDKTRKRFKTDEYKEMSSFDQVDAATAESIPIITIINAAVAAAIAIILVFTTLGSLTIYGLFMPCISGIFAALVSEYGCLIFTPSIYSRLKLKSDKYAEMKGVKYVGAKKNEPAPAAEGQQ